MTVWTTVVLLGADYGLQRTSALGPSKVMWAKSNGREEEKMNYE
jgi:hypothetical protein